MPGLLLLPHPLTCVCLPMTLRDRLISRNRLLSFALVSLIRLQGHVPSIFIRRPACSYLPTLAIKMNINSQIHDL
jgi:hypothetical protein